MGDYQINVHCECYHRRGLLYLARPWAWGRPCRRCRRGQNVIVVTPSGAQPHLTTVQAVAPFQMVTPAQTTRPMPMPMSMPPPAYTQQDAFEVMPSALPPKYNNAVAAH
ncbi:uncharacterized protein LOC115631866 [Scaptodrosophila lebanonensis]|uniref:Uncharacterized protein LOC115631866 n=1 Tax=Drosophila lebanonensis TaxID=7225 RepID=A0A6J2U8A7_DROLE|nr:uncharacterized protein LOC115631866 [Scaptodrosophila lebanonensis]